jgi:Uncharacterized protein conserved in bacteria
MNNSKKLFASLALICAFSFGAYAQKEKQAEKTKTEPAYDAELAKKLGADDYGMHQYVFVILKTGSAKIEDAEKRKEIQAGHMKNISRLADEGKLVLAGPFIEGGDLRGLYIFNVKLTRRSRKVCST